jgi:hypothetical protein
VISGDVRLIPFQIVTTNADHSPASHRLEVLVEQVAPGARDLAPGDDF